MNLVIMSQQDASRRSAVGHKYFLLTYGNNMLNDVTSLQRIALHLRLV